MGGWLFCYDDKINKNVKIDPISTPNTIYWVGLGRVIWPTNTILFWFGSIKAYKLDDDNNFDELWPRFFYSSNQSTIQQQQQQTYRLSYCPTTTTTNHHYHHNHAINAIATKIKPNQTKPTIIIIIIIIIARTNLTWNLNIFFDINHFGW